MRFGRLSGGRFWTGREKEIWTEKESGDNSKETPHASVLYGLPTKTMEMKIDNFD